MSIIDKFKDVVFEQEEKLPVQDNTGAPTRHVERPVTAATTTSLPPGLVVFLSTLVSLKDFIPDEASLYRAACKTVSAQGFIVPRIVEEIQSIIHGVDRNFDAETSHLEAVLQDQVVPCRARGGEIYAEKQQVEKRLAELKAESTRIAETIATAEQNHRVATLQLLEKTSADKAAHIKTIDKIKSYLGDQK